MVMGYAVCHTPGGSAALVSWWQGEQKVHGLPQRVCFTVPGVTKWCVVTRNSELVVIKRFVALDTAYFC